MERQKGSRAKLSSPTEVAQRLSSYDPVSGGREKAGKRDKREDVVLKVRQVFVSGQSAQIVSGHMISCRIGRMTGGCLAPSKIIDEFTKEALVIRVKRKLNSTDVVDALTDLFILRSPPDFIRSDSDEFISQKVRTWIGAVGAKTVFIEPRSP